MSLANALIGGGALVSSIFGAKNASDANKTNRQIADQNFQAQQRAAELAEQQYRDSLLGFTDGSGSSLQFVEGQGWVQTNAPDVEARRQRESEGASQVLEELLSIKRRDPEVIRRERDLAATAGFNTAFDDAQEMALTGAMRRGGGTYAQTAEQLAKNRGQSLADILQRNAAGAYSASFDELDAARDGPAGLYALLANRARGDSTLPTAGTAAGQSMGAGSGFINATARTQQPYIQPDNAWATGIGQSLGSLGGIMLNSEASAERSRVNDALIDAMSRRTVGNQL